MAQEKLSDGSADENGATKERRSKKAFPVKEGEKKAWRRFVESGKWKKVENETEWTHQPIPLEQVKEKWPDRTLAMHAWTIEEIKPTLPYLVEDPHAPLPAVAHFQSVKIEDFEVRGPDNRTSDRATPPSSENGNTCSSRDRMIDHQRPNRCASIVCRHEDRLRLATTCSWTRIYKTRMERNVTIACE